MSPLTARIRVGSPCADEYVPLPSVPHWPMPHASKSVLEAERPICCSTVKNVTSPPVIKKDDQLSARDRAKQK